MRAPAFSVVALVASAALAVSSADARLPACALALLLAGWWWGSLRLDAFEKSVLAPEIGRSASVTAVVTGPVRSSTFALRLPAEVRRFDERSLRERVLLELPLGRSPPQGAVLELRATVAAPRGPDDGFDERGWLARRGVHVVLHGRDWRIVGRRGGIGGLSDRLRAHVARAIAPGLDGERHAVLAGIVLGEDEGLTDELRDDFKASGLYHLLAVSGQNITFLALGVLGLAWLLGIPRLAAEVAAIGAIAAYVLAVGWQPSVVRAGVAGGLASLAWLLSRPRDRWHFLALGAVVLLAWTPASLLEPGFQLSFAAVGSIFLVVPRLRVGARGLPAHELAARGARRLDGVRRCDGTDPLAPVRQRPGLLAAGERPRHARDRAAARDRPRRLPARAGAAQRRARARLAERLARRLHRRLCAADRRAAVRAGRIRHGRSAAARDAGRAARPPTPAAVAATVGRREHRCSAAGSARLAAPAGGAASAAERACGSPSSTSGRATPILLQVPEGAVLVDQGPPEADVAGQLQGARRPAARRSRPHAPAARPHRRRRGRPAAAWSVDRVLDPRLAVSGPFERDALPEAADRAVPVVETRAGDAFSLGRLRIRVLWPDGPGTASEDPNLLPIVLLATLRRGGRAVDR